MLAFNGHIWELLTQIIIVNTSTYKFNSIFTTLCSPHKTIAWHLTQFRKFAVSNVVTRQSYRLQTPEYVFTNNNVKSKMIWHTKPDELVLQSLGVDKPKLLFLKLTSTHTPPWNKINKFIVLLSGQHEWISTIILWVVIICCVFTKPYFRWRWGCRCSIFSITKWFTLTHWHKEEEEEDMSHI